MTRIAVAALVLTASWTPLAAQTAQPIEARLDSIFARYRSNDSPGCALGVARNGRVTLERAWGLADLERRIPLTPETIFEAGSVSKQFTAAAVLLLAREGRLSLDDEVHRWIPELADYGAPVTLRQMMHHTSGLRDWGSVAGIGGWPRNTRALSHAHVLAIASRLRELNFPPGSEYDYSNSNYNLLAVTAERASGLPFPAFTRERLFEPLGMEHTSWRDDATRLVPGRAPSYSPFGGGWRAERAIESIYGNCCLLTTVGDLLKWNAAFDSTRLGGSGFREEQERRAVLAGGRTITYAAGLFIDEYKAIPVVQHGGATAGYRAFLARFPEQRLSVAVLCNAGNANPAQLGYAAAEQFLDLPPAAQAVGTAAPTRASVPASAITDKAGLYRNLRNMIPQRFVVRDGRLQTEAGIELVPRTATVFVAASGGTEVHFDGRTDRGYNVRLVTASGDTVPADLVLEADTTRAALAEYVGTWYSDEADASLRISLTSDGGRLLLRRDPNLTAPLQPIYRDGFRFPLGVLVFRRGASGGITELRLTASRVRNLRFVRRAAP